MLDTDELMKAFYLPHRQAGNALYNDDLLYLPEIYVIKSDTENSINPGRERV